MKKFILIAVLSAFTSISQASDPGGSWSTCKHYTGKIVTVMGSSCPAGVLKQY